MLRKNNFVIFIVLGCLFLFVNSQIAVADDYYVYSQYYGGYSAGGYVESYGVPGTWGDEIQYIYYLQGTMAYKVQVVIHNNGGPDDPTPYIDPLQHPDQSDPAHIGPIEPREFIPISQKDLSPYIDGGANGGFHVDSTGIYAGTAKGIHRFDQDWNYIEQVCPAIGAQSMAFDPGKNTWYAGTGNRQIYQLSDTNNDGSFMDESWVYIFTTPNYGGGHHDGMEAVAGFLWISDMTSDVIAKWEYDEGTNNWNEIEKYYYYDPEVVEGMGYGPNNNFWVGGWDYCYELGGKIVEDDPIADAGLDVLSYPPTIDLLFDASGSFHQDPERKIVLYEWDFDNDGVWDWSGPQPTTLHAYPAYYNPDGTIDWAQTAQTYKAVLRVTDDNSPTPKMAFDTREVTITEPPYPPVADCDGPYNARINETVPLDGSGSYHPSEIMYSPGHSWYDFIISWEWDLDDDGQFDDASGEHVDWSWPAEGTYFVHLKVTDNYGSFDIDSSTVIISALHDVAVDSIEPSTHVAVIGDVVTFDVVTSNIGDFTETYNVTLKYDGTPIETQPAGTLDPGDSAALQFSWDTTGVPEKLYEVTACADIVPGEILDDNNCKATNVDVIDIPPVAVFSPDRYTTLMSPTGYFGVHDQDLAMVNIMTGELGFVFDGTPFGFTTLDAVDLIGGAGEAPEKAMIFSVRENTLLGSLNNKTIYAKNEDIIRLNLTTGSFELLFDGSQFGVQNVDAVSMLDSGNLVFSADTGFSYKDFYFKDKDLVHYDTTNKELTPFLWGFDVTLTTLDGVDVLGDMVYFSVAEPVYICKPPMAIYLRPCDIGVYDMSSGHVECYLKGLPYAISTMDALSIGSDPGFLNTQFRWDHVRDGQKTTHSEKPSGSL